MLDSFGLDTDLGWMHDALEANDASELADMFDGVMDHFWPEDNYENDGDYDDEEELSYEDETASYIEEEESSYDDEEIVGDCLDVVSEYLDNVDYCTYYETEDDCQVDASQDGRAISGSCDEMMAWFGIPEEAFDVEDETVTEVRASSRPNRRH